MRTRLFVFLLLMLTAVFSASGGSVRTASQHFFRDDPLTREPESQDASVAAESEIGDLYEMLYNLFVQPRYKPSGLRAENLNTIDEVPDSSWFTNRIGSRTLTIDEVVHGPIVGDPPDPSRWIIIGKKLSGVHPGVTAMDAQGQIWFLQFDSRFTLKALRPPSSWRRSFLGSGLNQVESFLTVRSKRMEIDEKTLHRHWRGRFTRDDLNSILETVARRPDGTYRVVAGRLFRERSSAFRYEGTRPDDPNDGFARTSARVAGAARSARGRTRPTSSRAIRSIRSSPRTAARS